MMARMCGIAGIVSFDQTVQSKTLQRMAAAIAHRGPDGGSIYHSPTAGFAFRRLAVLDPDPRAMQPMTSADGRYVLVFNGEIYNFRELKKELPDQPWHTTGDTEVLLAALIVWGAGALAKLSGMFALALWDRQERTLRLARDAMGQKPLYYATLPDGIAFASELPALQPVEGWDRTINHSALGDYLRFGYVNAPATIYNGVRQLEPGAFMSFDADRTANPAGTQQWFDCNAISEESSPNVRTLVEEAVKEQLVSDVPLGVFLSGGIDSSIMALCARKQGPVQTFSIGFDDPRYDETRYAREVAKHLGTQHHEFRVTPNAAKELPRLAVLFGEPFGDSSALPTSALARETRRHVTVALSGDGGDELFGGYDRYRAMTLNLKPFRPLAPLGRRFAGGHPKSPVTRVGRLIRAAKLNDGQRYRHLVGIFDEPQVQALLPHADGDHAYLATWHAMRRTRSPAETALAMDRVTYLPGDLLTKVDRCSMRFNLEVRSPFMDQRIIRLAAGLKTRDLFRGGKKRLLREAFAKDLPASVFGRQKMGFAVPIGEWFRNSLREMLRDNVLNPSGFCRNHLRANVVEQLVEEHERGIDHTQRLYALLMLELWHSSYPSPSGGGKVGAAGV